MTSVMPSTASVDIRRATTADLPALGRLGALLVRTHHEFDPARFIPATPRTEQGYAAFLGTQLEAPSVVLLVAELRLERAEVLELPVRALETAFLQPGGEAHASGTDAAG